jgi:hypothetical protein
MPGALDAMYSRRTLPRAPAGSHSQVQLASRTRGRTNCVLAGGPLARSVGGGRPGPFGDHPVSLSTAQSANLSWPKT